MIVLAPTLRVGAHVRDAPTSTGEVDAERHEMRSHAEHGNESNAEHGNESKGIERKS